MKYLIMVCMSIISCTLYSQTKADIRAVKALNKQYITAWLTNDAEKVVALFEENASITPGGSGHFKGHEQIRSFWFPKDGSITTIDKFENKFLNLTLRNDIIVADSNSKLSWRYTKGDTKMARDQEGFALTFYRKQKDGSWKIWKQTWADIWAKDK